jgi:hypothetical protein
MWFANQELAVVDVDFDRAIVADLEAFGVGQFVADYCS